ncbi:hypothetical protein ACFO3J_05360 [Streptomyces polygonati]|uniref:Uncharacterized protein n=1 Tax=Streptomyces polygonati TaxID=1617087 RepID=A0ABV8HJ27_9ACTN
MDYLLSVSDHLAGDPSPRDLKYAVLHLQAAVEVLLKARLVQEDWTLVFDKPENASRERFEEGNFRSCGTSAALKRLRDITGVDPTANSGIESDLRQLVRWRNALQHYGLAAKTPAVEKLAANILDFLLEFVKGQLRPSLSPADSKVLNRQIGLVGDGLAHINHFIAARSEHLREGLIRLADDVVTCPQCGQDALVVGGDLTCQFCLVVWPNGEEVAFTYVETVLRLDIGQNFHDDGTPLVNQCPDCSADALVSPVRMASNREVAHLCFECGAKFDHLEPCWNCCLPYAFDVDNNGQCKKCGGVGADGVF